jgi:hypothetical protein
MKNGVKTQLTDRLHTPDPCLPTDDKLVALAQFSILQALSAAYGQPLEIAWREFMSVETAPMTWSKVRDFDRGSRTLGYLLHGRLRQLPVDDFTSERECLEIIGLMKLLEPPPGEWSVVLKRYGAMHLKSRVTNDVAKGKRSSVIFKIGITLAERGATEAEIACVIWVSKAWQSKHGNRPGELDREVDRIMKYDRKRKRTGEE